MIASERKEVENEDGQESDLESCMGRRSLCAWTVKMRCESRREPSTNVGDGNLGG